MQESCIEGKSTKLKRTFSNSEVTVGQKQIGQRKMKLNELGLISGAEDRVELQRNIGRMKELTVIKMGL